MGRKVDPDRARRVRRVVRRLTEAIKDDPFLVRLPGAERVAKIADCSIRDARLALEELVEAGWVRTASSGHQVIRRPRPVDELRTVAMVHASRPGGAIFADWVAYGADRRCRQLHLAFQNHWAEQETADRFLDHLAAEMPGGDVGWLLMFPPVPERLLAWQAEGRRIVLVDCDNPQAAVPQVLLNHRRAFELAAEHLASREHRHVARVLQYSFTIMAFLERQGEFLAGPWDVRMARGQAGAVVSAIGDWLERWRKAKRSDRPTAVMLYNLGLAQMFLHACEILRIDVPGELSVIGVGSRYGHDLERPMTFTSSGPAIEAGATAVDLLRDRTRLAERSTAILPADLANPDATVAKARRGR